MFYKNKVFLYILIIILIIVLGKQYYDYKIEQKENQILKVLNEKTKQINSLFKEKTKTLEKLAKDLEQVPLEKQLHLKLMKKANKEMGTHSIFSGFKNGLYFDTQGYWIEGFDPRLRPWYLETLKNNKTIISGPMYYTDISGQTIAWWSLSTILYKEKEALGVVSSEFLSDMILPYLKELNMTDFENLFLFHSKSEIIFTAKNKDNELKNIKEFFSKKLLRKIKEKEELVFINKEKSKKTFIIKIKDYDWVLCAIKKD